MKKLKYIVFTVLLLSLFFSSPPNIFAALYYQANGGMYWTQSGSEWHRVDNEGYCVSGRGPCGPNLWYQQWTYNHQGCGYDEMGHWLMANITYFPGKVSAWIDGYMGGTMRAASYSIAYGAGDSYPVSIDQNAYWETFVPLAYLNRVAHVTLTDTWGANPKGGIGYQCDGAGGYRVEFDEIKLEV
jgi:hypothetical protein